MSQIHIAFRDKPYDLGVVVGLCLALVPFVVFDVGGLVRFALTLAFILFLPGYALASLLFPRDGDVRWTQRVALSVGLSIAVVMLLAVVLTHTPWGFWTATVFPVVLVTTVGFAYMAYRRRMELAPAERLSLSIDLTPPTYGHFSKSDRILAVALVGTLLFAGGLAVLPLDPAVPHRFSEFFLLDSEGGVSEYPSVLNASQEGTVRLGIVNHQRTTVNFAVEVRLVAVTYEANQTVERSNALLDEFAVLLEDSAKWEEPYTFVIHDPGDYHLRFLLFIGPLRDAPELFLTLPIRVV